MLNKDWGTERLSMHTFQEWFEEHYEVSEGCRYPKKIFDAEVQKEYEKQCNLPVGSVNVRDCLKSIDMYHYDKNMRLNIGDIKYRGMYLGFQRKRYGNSQLMFHV